MSWQTFFKGSEAEPQTIYQLVDEARDAYRVSLIAARESLAAQYDTLLSELLLGVQSEEVPEGFRRMRADFFGKREDGLTTIVSNLDNPRRFRVKREDWQGLRVECRPLVWNGIDLRTDADLSDTSAVLAWFERWLDPLDQRPPDADGLQGVVHSLIVPDVGPDGDWIVPVDFGSAPLEAFTELVELLRAHGATRLRIESFEMQRQL